MKLGSARTIGAAALAVSAVIGSQLVAEAEAATAPAPTVKTVAATTGSTIGGTRVTIVGAHFAAVKSVLFGKTAGKSLHVLSSTKLQVTTPAHAAGTVDVRVQTRSGFSRLYKTDRFVFVAPPAVTSVSPSTGPMTGATRVTVTGTGFSKVTSVRFGTTLGKSLHVLSSTKLQVTAPAHATARVDLRVVNQYGTSATRSTDGFSFRPIVHIDKAVVGPNTPVIVTGIGFRPGSTVGIALDTDLVPGTAAKASATGYIKFPFNVPDNIADGRHQVTATGPDSSGVTTHTPVIVVADATPPLVTRVDVSTAEAAPGDSITIRAHVTDHYGVDYVGFDVASADDGEGLCGTDADPASRKEYLNAVLTGAATDGDWQLTCNVSTAAVPGSYDITFFAVADVNGNQYVDGSAPSATITVTAPAQPPAQP